MIVSTVTTTTTTTTTALASVATVLGLIAAVLLIALLGARELAAARTVVGQGLKTSFAFAFKRFLTVAIAPLILVFAAIVITEILLIVC
jgi:hypothetical protein